MTIPQRHGRTDRRTDELPANTALCVASRGKKQGNVVFGWRAVSVNVEVNQCQFIQHTIADRL